MSLKVDRFIKEYNFIMFSSFLEKHGWKNDGTYNEIFTIWHRPDKEESEYELIVPENKNIKKYEDTLLQIIENLAHYYGKKEYQIIDEFQSSIKDRVKISIRSETTQDGYIPLLEGVRLLENTKEMLVSSFLASKNKKKNFIGPRPENVNKVIDNIQMGQTEEGSYVINIFVPKNYYEDGQPPLNEESNESFTRDALTVIEDATTELLSKADLYSTTNDISIFNESFKNGVSSNFCNAISEISSNGKSDVFIEITYNNGIAKKDKIREIKIKKEYIPIIENVGEYYKKDLSEADYQINGYVTKLHQEIGEEDGEITLSANIEGKLKKVQIILSPEQYGIAQEAHRNKQLLLCRGTLNMKDRHTSLTNIISVLLGNEE
jgi:hypothetical protein